MVTQQTFDTSAVEIGHDGIPKPITIRKTLIWDTDSMLGWDYDENGNEVITISCLTKTEVLK